MVLGHILVVLNETLKTEKMKKIVNVNMLDALRKSSASLTNVVFVDDVELKRLRDNGYVEYAYSGDFMNGRYLYGVWTSLAESGMDYVQFCIVIDIDDMVILTAY